MSEQFKCDTCNLTFISATARANHNRFLHQTKAKLKFKRASGIKTAELSRINGKFHCPYCAYSNEWSANLSRHLKTCASYQDEATIDSTNLNDIQATSDIQGNYEAAGNQDEAILIRPDQNQVTNPSLTNEPASTVALIAMGFSHVDELEKYRVGYFNNSNMEYLVCLICFEGLGSINSLEKHLRIVHGVKNNKYSILGDIVNNRRLLRIPQNETLQTRLPLIKVHAAVKCDRGHVSTAAKSINQRKCITPQCNYESMRLISVQHIGRKMYYLDEMPDESNYSYDRAALAALSMTELQQSVNNDSRETRSSNPMDRIINRVDEIFPPATWTDDIIKNYKDTLTNIKITNALQCFCNEARHALFDSVLVRFLIGADGVPFNFHQEWTSTEKAISLAAQYITYCISDYLPAAFYSDSAEVQSIIVQLKDTVSQQSDAANNAAIIGFILDFFVQELKSPVLITAKCHSVGIVKFIIFQSMDKNKILRKANSISKLFSYLEYVMKVAVALKAKYEQDQSGVTTNDRVQQLINSCIRSDYFQTIISTHSAFKSATACQFQQPIFIPHGDHLSKGGQIVRLTAIQELVRGHLDHCHQKMQTMFGRIPLIDIPEGLTDRVADDAIGTSIFNQNLDKIIKNKTMQEIWMDVSEEVAKNNNFFQNGRIINRQAVSDFYNNIYKDLALDLIVLIHITGGSPPRKTELALVRVSNDQFKTRNFFLDGTLLYFSINYHKTTNKHENYRPTYHFLPATVSKLIFNLICFLRPAVMAAMQTANNDFIWPSKLIEVANPHSPIEISQRFERAMAQRTGLAINFREWRHLLEIYMREIVVASQNHCEIEMDAVDGQAGRSSRMGAATYGILPTILRNTTVDQISREKNVSLAWHRKILPETNELHANSTPSIPFFLIRNANKMIIPPSKIPLTPETLECTPVAIDRCIKELYGPSAFVTFKQNQLLQHVLQTKDDIVVHMQTGSGKSNTYLVPAKINPNKSTVVFVPLSALLLDTLDKCQRLGVSAVQWVGSGTRPESIVLVHYQLEPGARQEFSVWLDYHVQQGTVCRVVFDEAHLLIEWHEFMQLKPLSCLRGTIPVQLIFQSATLPNSIKTSIFEMFSINSGHIVTIEDLNPRANLEFITRESTNSIATAIHILQEHLETNTGNEERVMIFLPTIQRLEVVKSRFDSAMIPCTVFHGELGREKAIALAAWKEGRNNIKTMLTTKAMNAGVDYPHIHLVMVMDYTNSICDLVQSFGRAGRDNKPAKCVLLSNDSLIRNSKADRIVSTIFNSHLCLRFLLDKYMYDWGYNCQTISEPDAQRCSRCKTQSTSPAGIATSTSINSISSSHPINSEEQSMDTIQTFIYDALEDDDLLGQIASQFDNFQSSISTNSAIAGIQIGRETVLGGEITSLMDRLRMKCAYCIGKKFTLFSHSIIDCPKRRIARTCNECAVASDHYGNKCSLNDVKPNSRCWRCWLDRSYGGVITHINDSWGKSCPNKSWHGLIKLWAATIWHFRETQEVFGNTIESFSTERSFTADNLKTFIIKVSQEPELFLHHLSRIIDTF